MMIRSTTTTTTTTTTMTIGKSCLWLTTRIVVVGLVASLSILAPFLPGVQSMNSANSINIELEKLEMIDLSALGTPNLDLWDPNLDLLNNNGENENENNRTTMYNLTTETVKGVGNINESCRYKLQIDINITNSLTNDILGESNFKGTCSPTDTTGTNPQDDLPWHTPRKNWLEFPDYIYKTTGFNHVSINWNPCGNQPAGYKQPRYDLNFYTVIPQYRTYMLCDTYKIPEVCQYNQTTHQGRSMFTIPRLVNDPNLLANMPLHFQPDPEFPEAFQYEGLIHYNSKEENFPQTVADWELPTFLMSTYDAAVVSWRAMIPQSFLKGKDSAESSQSQFYVFQTMMGLPSEWNMEFERKTGIMSVFLHGTSADGVCGSEFDRVKNEQQYGIVFEDEDEQDDIDIDIDGSKNIENSAPNFN